MAYRFVQPRILVGDLISNMAGAKLSFFDESTTDAKISFSDFALSVANTDPVVADSDGLFGDIFLDVTADVTLTTSTDVVIYGPITTYAPEDTVLALLASLVSVLDTAGDFTATTVETILTEISDDWGKLARINTWSAIQTYAAAIAMADNAIGRAELTDYSITHNAVSSSSGLITLDLSTGNSFVTTLTENITAVTISNPSPTGKYCQFTWKIIQDSVSARTVAQPAAVLWPGGTAPTISTALGAIDKITYETIDEGTVFLGTFSQAFA